MDRLLTNEEIINIVDCYHINQTLLCIRVAKAEHAKTLRAIGEGLKAKLQGESCSFIYDDNDLGLKAFVESLLRGEMPEG